MRAAITSTRLAIVVLLAGSAGLLAAEHPEGEVSIISGSIANAIATLITFGLVLVVLGKWVWPVVLRSMQQRENFIRDALQSAQRDREAAEARLREYERKLVEARQEATAIVDEGRRDAEVLRRKIQDDARHEAEAILARAKREIGIARDTAVKDIYTLSADLATDLAGRIIKKELDPKGHERLLRESIDHVAATLESNN